MNINANTKEAPNRSLRAAFRSWLETGRFDFFVGLAINDQSVGPRRARDLVREWNARMDRRIVGKQWLRRPDERMFALHVLEKPGSNPHWHSLIRLEPPEPDRWPVQARKLQEYAELEWRKLIKSGTVDVQQITRTPEFVARYIAKELAGEIQFREFILPDEFRH
ncbi:hypothetical protein SAMN05519103_04010 [Rhizobiales bacterium GAS113]|nr:hypothetical protein SAMN05519103_04010 [Rhizobiales bacterium GAS113]